jgi:hypothetical protein
MKTSKIAPLALLIPAVVLAQPAPVPPSGAMMPPPGTMRAPPFNPVNPVNPAKAADALNNAKEREGALTKSVGEDTMTEYGCCTVHGYCSYDLPY